MAGSRWGTITGIYERFAVGDFRASIERLDPAVVLVVEDSIPDGGTYLGLAGLRDYMTRFLEPWQSLTISPVTVEEVGDSFLVNVAQHGVGRGSEAEADMNYSQIWTFRGQTVVRIEVVRDEDRARAMLGLD